MDKLLTQILSIIFPPTEEITILEDFKLDSVNTLYAPGLYKRVQYLSNYTDPVIRAAVKENKFHGNPKASLVLGKLLALYLKSERITKDSGILVPIPLGAQRKRKRGYNQVENIIKMSDSELSIQQLLKRVIETEPQTNLNQTARLKNTKDIFRLLDKPMPSDVETIILVDDVVTTGATLSAARKAITEHFPTATIVCLAIAH